jgi:crotonobetainyl-CoA:carnitine CoA-transferase CaiB-like acyl-CoA transferase
VPGGPVYTYDQILADPHVAARRMVVEMDHPKIGRMKAMGIPVKSTGELLEIREPAPWLGQHTEEVLKDLGYGEKELEPLWSEGVLYDKYRNQQASPSSAAHAPGTVTAQ